MVAVVLVCGEVINHGERVEDIHDELDDDWKSSQAVIIHRGYLQCSVLRVLAAITMTQYICRLVNTHAFLPWLGLKLTQDIPRTRIIIGGISMNLPTTFR